MKTHTCKYCVLVTKLWSKKSSEEDIVFDSNLNRRILTSTNPGMDVRRDNNWWTNIKRKSQYQLKTQKKNLSRIIRVTIFFLIYLDYIYTAVCSLSASVRNSWLVASPSLESHGVFVILNSDRTLVLWDAGTSVEVVEGSSTKPKKKISSSLCHIHIFKNDPIFY